MADNSSPHSIVLAHTPRLPAPRRSLSLARRVVGLLPALVATPQRALFTAGVTLGLAAPPVLRFVAHRALNGTIRSLVPIRPRKEPSLDELVVERVVATRVLVRRRH